VQLLRIHMMDGLVLAATALWQQVLPAPASGRARLARSNARRQCDLAAALADGSDMRAPKFVEMRLQFWQQFARNGKTALDMVRSIPHHQPPGLQIEIANPQADTLDQPDAGRVDQCRGQPFTTEQLAQHSADLIPSQHIRHRGRASLFDQDLEPGRHAGIGMPVQAFDRFECALARRRACMSLTGEVRQEALHLGAIDLVGVVEACEIEKRAGPEQQLLGML